MSPNGRTSQMTDRPRFGVGPWPALPRPRWQALSLPWRRAAVVAMYAGAVVTVALIWARASDEIPGWTGWLAFVAALVAMAGFAGVCTTATRSAWWRDSLDERDTELRATAYRHGYLIITIVTLAALVYAMITAGRTSWWLPASQQDYWSLFVGLAFLACSLPPAIVAWIEPDPEFKRDG